MKKITATILPMRKAVIIFTFLAIGIASCQKDVVNKQPSGDQIQSTAAKTQGHLKQTKLFLQMLPFSGSICN